MRLDIHRRQMEPGVTVLEVCGHLTAGGESQLQEQVEQLAAEGVRKLVLEMAAVEELDSAGLGVLVSCSVLLQQLGGELRLASASERVLKQLRLTRLDLVLPVDSDAEQACRHFAAG